MAAWLLDVGIDAQERVGRSFAIRYEGLVEARKFGRASNDASIGEFSSNRISALLTEAELLGYCPVVNKDGKMAGIAVRMPSITTLSAGLAGDELVYRLLSGMAHSSPWAVMALANRLTGKQAVNLIDGDSRTSVQFMEKTLTTKSVGLLGMWATRWCSDVVGRQAGLFGWPTTEMGAAISEIKRLIIGWRRFAE